MTIAEFPEKLKVLFEPKRYKVFYGGRGAGKSVGISRALLTLGASKPLRILCAREIQKSISDSVHKTLSDHIKDMGLSSFYEVLQNSIRGINGTEFMFHGLRHNIDNIKSAEGVDICWVEEAQSVSKASWEVLIPTIRKENSEIWVTFNPELDTDETYTRFVVDPPKKSFVVKMNWSDNPWFPSVLDDERKELQGKDPDSYLTVWEGHCRQTLSGAVYEDELRSATEQERIRNVPYYPGKGVQVFCDLGWSDYTSLWFVQKVGMEYRALLTYQNRHKLWDHYLKVIQDTGYLIDTIWLPHDGANGSTMGKSIEQQTKDSGRKVRILPRLSVVDGINAARTIFPSVYFDQKGCADGLQSLKRYVWEETAKGLSTREPKHDENSHYADAFRYFAVGFSEGKPQSEVAQAISAKLRQPKIIDLPQMGTGWMK
jgi:phage terminase large subunit